jgi:DNA-directed RNA polymerase specialized sigma24 family protein
MQNSPASSTVANATDEELAAASRRRMHAATRELVHRHAEPTYAICTRWLSDEPAASAACVEIFSKAFDVLDPEAPFRLTLLRIATRHLEAMDVPAVVEQTSAGKHSLENLLSRCLSALEPEHRLILLLRDLTGLSIEGISKVLEIPEATSLARLSRARTELARQVSRNSSPTDVV